MNYWLMARKKRQWKHQQEFMNCLRQGGSFIIDWDEVDRLCGFEKCSEITGWNHSGQFDFGETNSDTAGV